MCLFEPSKEPTHFLQRISPIVSIPPTSSLSSLLRIVYSLLDQTLAAPLNRNVSIATDRQVHKSLDSAGWPGSGGGGSDGGRRGGPNNAWFYILGGECLWICVHCMVGWGVCVLGGHKKKPLLASSHACYILCWSQAMGGEDRCLSCRLTPLPRSRFMPATTDVSVLYYICNRTLSMY